MWGYIEITTHFGHGGGGGGGGHMASCIKLIITEPILTIILFLYSAHRGSILPHSKSYSFHGFYFIYLFAYKYYLDASFVFISCQKLEATGSTVRVGGEGRYKGYL